MNRLNASIHKRPVNIILIVSVIGAYLLNNLFLKKNSTGIIHYFFMCHFNDLICPLLFFSYINLLLLTVDKELTSLWKICLISICTSFVWEVWAPLVKKSSITDPIDVVCYFLGSIIYWNVLNFTQKRNSHPRRNKNVANQRSFKGFWRASGIK